MVAGRGVQSVRMVGMERRIRRDISHDAIMGSHGISMNRPKHMTVNITLINTFCDRFEFDEIYTSYLIKPIYSHLVPEWKQEAE